MILIVGMDKNLELQRLGQMIRSKRVKKGLTQLQVAQSACVDRNYIGMLERGERNPSFLSLLKIAQGLGLSVQQLLMP